MRSPLWPPSAAQSGDKPIFILCDDVYRGLCMRPVRILRPCPPAGAALIAQSFSKPWAMTGWRIGYLMGSAPVIRKLTALHGHILTCAPACSRPPVRRRWKPIRRRCARPTQKKTGAGAAPPPCDGALLPRPGGRVLCLPGYPCLRPLLRGVLPSSDRGGRGRSSTGSCFGTEGHIRISYCCGEQTLERGMDRLEAFLEKAQTGKKNLTTYRKQEVAQMKQKTLFRGIATALATPDDIFRRHRL